MPIASSSNGYIVPSSTEAHTTTNSMLLPSSMDSRDTSAKRAPSPTFGARQAYSASAPPTTMPRNTRMNSPRRGSVANACTDDSTPERTMKVPSSDSVNASSASSTVHDLNAPRFSVTASEWISAVPASQGMKDAFSTGSQNHQPPQPSS